MSKPIDKSVRVMRSTVWDAIQIAAGERAPHRGESVVDLGACALQRSKMEGNTLKPIENDVLSQDVTTHFIGLMVAPEPCGINVVQFGYGEEDAGVGDRKLINSRLKGLSAITRLSDFALYGGTFVERVRSAGSAVLASFELVKYQNRTDAVINLSPHLNTPTTDGLDNGALVGSSRLAEIMLSGYANFPAQTERPQFYNRTE